MINKALEIVEARWLFDIPPSCIEVIIHPQSIVHSIVEFIDGSQIAQLSLPDMRLPIQYALTFPRRLPSPVPTLELPQLRNLEFLAPNERQLPALELAYRALEIGGTAPAIMNAANEIAVAAFLDAKIKFPYITRIVADTMEHVPAKSAGTLQDVFESDSAAREYSAKSVSKMRSQNN